MAVEWINVERHDIFRINKEIRSNVFGESDSYRMFHIILLHMERGWSKVLAGWLLGAFRNARGKQFSSSVKKKKKLISQLLYTMLKIDVYMLTWRQDDI